MHCYKKLFKRIFSAFFARVCNRYYAEYLIVWNNSRVIGKVISLSMTNTSKDNPKNF